MQFSFKKHVVLLLLKYVYGAYTGILFHFKQKEGIYIKKKLTREALDHSVGKYNLSINLHFMDLADCLKDQLN